MTVIYVYNCNKSMYIAQLCTDALPFYPFYYDSMSSERYIDESL